MRKLGSDRSTAASMVELIGGGDLKAEPEEALVEIDSEEEEAEKVVKRRRRRKACDSHQKRACVDCTKRCARIHGRAASSSPSPYSSKARSVPAVPCFFKVMMGLSDDMDIPPPYARTILDLAGSNIYLEDAFGLRWHVRLCLSDDGVLSFGHGWKNFVLDHAVSCGEFVVFRQIARSVFTVQMFAPSAVERLFLCEKNRRQSRKRKPRQKTSSPSLQSVKTSKDGVENRKKKQRTDHQNGMDPREAPVQVCIDDSDIPDSASEMKYSETSQRVPGVGAAESQEISEVPIRHQCEILDAEAEIAEDCRISEEQRGQCNDRVNEDPASDATEMEHDEGFSLPTNDDASGPLALMDLNEGSIDDIFLSADMYEFETDMNMEGPLTTAQSSGFSCIEDASQNHHSSMGVGQSFVTPAETLSCSGNKEMTEALETGSGYACAIVHGIDINALPATEPSPFAENSSLPADIEVNSGEFALSSCNKDKDNDSLPCKDSQCEENEVKHDKQLDGQGDKQVSTVHNTAEVISSSTMLHEHPHLSQNLHQTEDKSEGLQSGILESGGVLALAAACSKFCIAVPAPGQTWLELPNRLPAIPRTKKQGRKVVILKDPCMRLWPVLYQCTPRFSGFITGWVDICRENNLQDTCEFELSGNSELSFQVVVPSLQ